MHPFSLIVCVSMCLYADITQEFPSLGIIKEIYLSTYLSEKRVFLQPIISKTGTKSLSVCGAATADKTCALCGWGSWRCYVLHHTCEHLHGRPQISSERTGREHAKMKWKPAIAVHLTACILNTVEKAPVWLLPAPERLWPLFFHNCQLFVCSAGWRAADVRSAHHCLFVSCRHAQHLVMHRTPHIPLLDSNSATYHSVLICFF